jgi:two-component system phosphate regulon sensor histidine kinase PhoR
MRGVSPYQSGGLKSARWPVFSMVLAIMAITGFQGYWLKNNYDREKQNLDIKTNAAFRQTILKLQSSKLKLDRLIQTRDSARVTNFRLQEARKSGKKITIRDSLMLVNPRIRLPKPIKSEPTITLMNLLQERFRDSLRNFSKDKAVLFVKTEVMDSAGHDLRLRPGKGIITRSRDNPLDLEMLDSLLSPHMIRRIEVDSITKPNVNIITIRYYQKDSLRHSFGRGVKETKEVIMDAASLPYRDEPDENIAYGISPPGMPAQPDNGVVNFLITADSIATSDSVTVGEVTNAFAERLKEDNLNLKFEVSRLESSQWEMPNAVTVGLSRPATYAFTLQNTFGYMLGKLKLPILFSLLLLGVTIAAFVMLYRNMVKQHRLSQLKNEFISNITHELKTPIATVGVAIEALKNFNALDDPKRTREYLDISQNELQRLNLLVDKVLKLSVFESKAIELKKEDFDLKQLTEEILNSMKLQFEKYRANVKLRAEGGNYTLEADKLHITSVIYNLLDNALKYSQENPVIEVNIVSKEEHISLSVKDNGIGIPQEYKGKVFEKFFRVPMGDKHNIKGYGLGLSYVSEIASRHQGYITVDSELGKGSTFTLNIPYKEAPVIKFDGQKKIRKEFRFGH